jgi:hypothetical protein
MSGNRSRVHAQLDPDPGACANPGLRRRCTQQPGPSVSSESLGQHDLAGVRTGTSITGCTPLRMNGPWRCGARADIMLRFIREDTAAMTGIYASDNGRDGDAFQETGRVVEVPESGSARLWFRVMMRDHSSCLFTSNLQGEEMGGSYIRRRDLFMPQLSFWRSEKKVAGWHGLGRRPVGSMRTLAVSSNATEEIKRLSRRLYEAGASSFMGCFSITTVPAPFPVAANNIAMLPWTEGEQHSGCEISTTLRAGGYKNIKVKPTFGYWSIVTGVKP